MIFNMNVYQMKMARDFNSNDKNKIKQQQQPQYKLWCAYNFESNFLSIQSDL